VSDAGDFELRVLRVIEELLKVRPPGDRRPVDANMVLKRMHLGEEFKDEVAQTMSDLWEKGDLELATPVPLTDGGGKVLDVDVRAITQKGLERLWAP
jgi:hypothetical protein